MKIIYSFKFIGFQLKMNRQWKNNNNHMTFSTISQGINQANLTPYFPSRSKQKIQQKSVQRRTKRHISYQELGPSVRLNTQNCIETQSITDMEKSQFKQNIAQKEIENVVKRVRELEGKMMESEYRVQVLERNNKNTSQLTSSLQEYMRNQFAQIKDRQALGEKISNLQRELNRLAMVKADRKELQNLELGNYYGLTQRCNQLTRENEKVNQQITQINGKFERMIGKIETSFLMMGQKYEEFIEGHIIKSIEQVNKVNDSYRVQIEQLAQEQIKISQNIEQIQRKNSFDEKGSKCSVFNDIFGLSLPNIRLVQTIAVQSTREQKKFRGKLSGLKEHIKEQHKETPHLSESIVTSSSFNSDSLLNNMYDSLDQCTNTFNNSSQLHFEKVIYKLDKDFNLLDQNERYILHKDGSNVQLTAFHIDKLRQNKLIV